jgi:phage gp45-like
MIDLYARIRQLGSDLREYARQVVANAIQFTQFTLSTSSGEHDKVAGYRTEGAEEQPYDYEVRRVQHFGFRSRPPADVWAVRLAATGGATNNVTVGEESTRFGPSDLGDGEVALYNSVSGLEMRFDSNGNINAQSAPGKVVNLQGGDFGVAREKDSVDCGTLIFVPGPAAALQYIPPGGVMPPIPKGGAAIALSGVITSASQKTKTG